MAILDNYMEAQCHLDPDDDCWATSLILWHGDVKTILRLRSVMMSRASTSERAYDKKAWIMPVLGLWHLRYNLLKLIHKLHWGGNEPVDTSCLQYAADKWDRTNVHKPSNFHKLEELLVHSYHSRVVALLLERSEQKSKQTFYRAEDASTWMESLSPGDLRQLVVEIVAASNPKGIDDLEAAEPLNEQIFNHVCFIRHMDVYFLLRRSIQHGDVGLLKQALRETTILFQAKEARSENYGPELLRLLHTCDSDAASTRLQSSILKSMLVNLAGAEGKTFEVDRCVEFVNRMVAIGQRSRSRSVQVTEEFLRQITLTTPFALRLRAALDGLFGRKYSNHHPPKKAAEDIWLVASDLAHDAFQRREEEVFTAYTAVNLWREGYRSLGENVQRYNAKRINSFIGQEDDNEDTYAHDDDTVNMASQPQVNDDTLDDVLDSIMREAF